MKHIKVRNVGHAFVEGFWHMRLLGPECRQESRNGPVIVSPGPVLTEYEFPMERVLFDPKRDANPVFHLMEAIWMLAGSNDVSFLLPFNEKFVQYAEDDGLVWGAYGHRWTRHFGFDQIHAVVNELKTTPTSRRAVMGMWDPTSDLGANKRDLPCNTHIYFDCIGDRLNMTVCCRSNDMLWGAYGANAVHFSILQEVIASALGIEMGVYRQFSNNFHLYTDLPMVQRFLDTPPTSIVGEDPYDGLIHWCPMVGPGENWRDLVADCWDMVHGHHQMFRTEFMKYVAKPLHDAYLARKSGEEFHLPPDLYGVDWAQAFKQWVARRDAR